MVRTFIYGSCVSRDTFEYLDKDAFSLLRYVARSSLVSAFSPPGPVPLTEGHELSPFQLRQVQTDAASGLLPLLREHSDLIDLLLWDLVDERLGFYENGEGHVITDSIELRKAGDHAALDGYRHYAFGSRQHLERFIAVLPLWREFLVGQDLLRRLVILAPPWAETDAYGVLSPASFGMSAREANRIFALYHQPTANGLSVASIGKSVDVHADQDHKWGLAAFHYSDSTYEILGKELLEVLSDALDREDRT